MPKPKSESKPERFYITTTLPYVNAELHLGHAMELLRADIIARFNAMIGKEVFFNTGTDEHGLKIYRKAMEEGVEAQVYVDKYAEKFKTVLRELGIEKADHVERHFSRTTDPRHVSAAQEFWRRCDKNGFIKKKNYELKYCVGCELEKTDSELQNGKCPLHPSLDIEIVNEENYFFLFSKFTDKLLALYESKPDFVVPSSRANEIKAFVGRGLEDFSISRLKSKMPWGVPVPGDDAHVMYVWFDALVNYISAIGWPTDDDSFKKWWQDTGGVVQYCGKDNLRQQSAMWQAMLMAADLPPSRQIVINGFLLGEGGVKMSKSLGNVVYPIDIVAEYGTDALRYYVARELSPFEDSPFTKDGFKEAYNANLANGIGNLASRVMRMATTYGVTLPPGSPLGVAGPLSPIPAIPEEYIESMESYNIASACDMVWALISKSDKKINETEPFKLVKSDPDEAKKIVAELLAELRTISYLLRPIMPETAETIHRCIIKNEMPQKPLFARK